MTPFERTHPKQINGSRRARIAKGSGVTVTDVNQLLERFRDAQKMMKSLARGAVAACRGCRARCRQARPPAAAAQEEQERQPGQAGGGGAGCWQRAAEGRSKAAASAFGMPSSGQHGGDPTTDLDPSTLPKGFDKFLGKNDPRWATSGV